MKEKRKIDVDTLSDLTRLTKGTRSAVIRQLSHEQINSLLIECENNINRIASEKKINYDALSRMERLYTQLYEAA